MSFKYVLATSGGHTATLIGGCARLSISFR